MLTIMSALAQEESRSISENIRWSIQKKFQNGEPIIDLKRTIGYDLGADGAWIINPEQAKTVHLIYETYAAGRSSTAIAKLLNERGITTVMGCKWRSCGVLRVLRNEIYAGHLLMQKTATVDFLTHRHIKNQTILPQYFIENHHPAIIEPELLSRVRAQLERAARKRTYMQTNGREVCAFTNLRLPDGSAFKRMSYRAAATGYMDKDGSGGYAFQYSVLKNVEQRCVPGTEKSYLCRLAVEQSFMEMLYAMKQEYLQKGEECVFCLEMRAILDTGERFAVEKQKLAMIAAERDRTADAYSRASAGKQKAALAGRDVTAYAELLQDLERKMEALDAQRTALEKQMHGADLRGKYEAFLRMLRDLPEVNVLGKPIVVNGREHP